MFTIFGVTITLLDLIAFVVFFFLVWVFTGGTVVGEASDVFDD